MYRMLCIYGWLSLETRIVSFPSLMNLLLDRYELTKCYFLCLKILPIPASVRTLLQFSGFHNPFNDFEMVLTGSTHLEAIDNAASTHSMKSTTHRQGNCTNLQGRLACFQIQDANVKVVS